VAAVEESVVGDLRDRTSLRAAVDGATAVVHLAAVTHSRSPQLYQAVNLEGTKNLVDAAETCGVRRFVLGSTRAISPRGGAYSLSKRRGEDAVRSSGLDWTILRLPEVYGLNSGEGVDDIIGRVRADRLVPVVGRGDDVVCPVLAGDIVPVFVRALEESIAIGRAYTLAGPCVPVREFVEHVGRAFGRSPRIVPIPVTALELLVRLARVLPLPLYPDQLSRLRAHKPEATGEARTELAFQPRSLRVSP
jgi:nucleoside-diphosphate-sugar epimerase